MKRFLCIILTLSVLAASLIGCLGEKTSGGSGHKPMEIEELKSGMTPENFDERLFAFLEAATEGSFMVSPMSLRFALGLLLAGASGETEAELVKALGVSDAEEWIASCSSFAAFAEDYRPSEGCALRLANSVWRNEESTQGFKAAYLSSAEKNFGAEELSFTEQNVIRRVNEWAENKTQGLIPNLLPDDYDTANLSVVLMNALYFKSAWRQPFDSSLTEKGSFTAEDGRRLNKEFMLKQEQCLYYAQGGTQLVVVPMMDGMKMVFVLGDASKLGDKIGKAESANVRMKIPKLELESAFDRGEFITFLKAYGVEKAFGGAADFSRMIDRDIYVSDIVQKTRLKLDENGIEAAAASAGMMNEKTVISGKDVEFVADRPFSFFILSGGIENSILFAGKIVE